MVVIRRLLVVVIWLIAVPACFAFFFDQPKLYAQYSFEWYQRGFQQAMFAFVPACILHACINWISLGAKRKRSDREED